MYLTQNKTCSYIGCDSVTYWIKLLHDADTYMVHLWDKGPSNRRFCYRSISSDAKLNKELQRHYSNFSVKMHKMFLAEWMDSMMEMKIQTK